MRLTVKFYNETLTISHKLPDASTIYYPAYPETNTILSLKNSIELAIGLPIELQILSFIDELDLPNGTTLKEFGISNNSRINLSIKSEIDYKDIFLAARHANLKTLKDNDIFKYVVVKQSNNSSQSCQSRDNDNDHHHHVTSSGKGKKSRPKSGRKEEEEAPLAQPLKNVETPENPDLFPDFSPYKLHILSVERMETIRKSWPVKDDKTIKPLIYDPNHLCGTFDPVTAKNLSNLCSNYGFLPRKSIAQRAEQAFIETSGFEDGVGGGESVDDYDGGSNRVDLKINGTELVCANAPPPRVKMSEENFLHLSQHAFQNKKSKTLVEIISEESANKKKKRNQSLAVRASQSQQGSRPRLGAAAAADLNNLNLQIAVPSCNYPAANSSLQTVYSKKNSKNLKTWENYRVFICMLSAIANNQQALLVQLYYEHPNVFLKCNTKISQRTILHVACSINQGGSGEIANNREQIKRWHHSILRIDNSCLMTVLYKFNQIDKILHKKDYKGLTPAKLAKRIGKNSNGQILLKYAWELRTQ